MIMKLTKLMLSASIAALALVSCNKNETTPEGGTAPRSVEISFENIVTKGPAGDKIHHNTTPVMVNDHIRLFTRLGIKIRQKRLNSIGTKKILQQEFRQPSSTMWITNVQEWLQWPTWET